MTAADIIWGTSSEEFEERCMPTEYFHRGMIYSEAFAFCHVAEHCKVDLVLESGTASGRSTELIGKYGFPIISVDRAALKVYSKEENQKLFDDVTKRLAYLPHITTFKGDSTKLLPKLCKQNSKKRIAVLIDGPKGKDATDLAKECSRHKNVVMVAIHDQIQADYDMGRLFSDPCYTSIKWFRGQFGHLDREDVDALNANGNEFKYTFPGFGLGISVLGGR